MACVEVSFRSVVLGLRTEALVLIPEAQPSAPRQPDAGWPCLWLLHGLSDDHTAWTRYAALERYWDGRPLAIVMPNGHRSFYADMAAGLPYFRFLTEELPRVMRSLFPLSSRREDNFAAGLSMGGGGALVLGLNCPDRYAKVASLSGAVLPAQSTFWNDERSRTLELVFGSADRVAGSRHDFLALARDLPPERRPELFLACGEDDFLYQTNASFHQSLTDLGYAHRWETDPGYGHTWDYWELKIGPVMDWLQKT